MILSNFMRKNVKRKAKVPKPAVSSRPLRSPTSPAFSVSPEEVFDIHEKATESRMIQDSNSERDESVDRHSPYSSRTRLNTGSHLVLDYIPEPLEDWFPQELLSGSHGSRNSGRGLGVSSVPEPAITEVTRSDATREESNWAPTSHARNASMSHSRELPGRLAPFPLKKSIPAPILIPEIEGAPTNTLIDQPAVRVAAATPSRGSDPQAPPRTFPPSPISSEDMSAISGTTIARALIGNSFTLSSSDRASRYRSGMTRQDSATLPRGDHPLMNSPYLHDRRISGGESVNAHDSAHELPKPHVPPSTGARLPDQARASVVYDKSQASSDASSSSTEYLPSGTHYTSPDVVMHSRLSRRISRILEVPSPVPTTPMSPQSIRDTQPMKSGSSIAASSVFARMDETDSDVPNTASHTPATTPSPSHQKGADSSVSIQSSELFSSSPTDHGLDEYAFVAPESVQSVISPDSDAGVFVGHLQSKYSDISLRRRRARALGATPSSTSGTSFKTSGVLSERTGIFQRNKKQIRLPIGDRPRSILVPQTPITPALIASATVQHPSALSQFPLVPSSAVPVGHLELPLTALADVDILATTPLSGGIFATRQHTFGIPRRVTVAQEYDLLDYAITVTPESPGSSNFLSSSSSAGEQTFPETPNVFTPLLSPDFPVSQQGLRLLPGRPQAARSRTHPVPDDFDDKVALSQTKTLDVPHRGEDLTKDDGSPASRRSISATSISPMKSTPPPEHVPPRTVFDVTSVSASPIIAQKTDTIDQKTDTTIVSTASPVDHVDPLMSSSLYHLSTSSDKLQEEEALQALAPHSALSIPSIVTPNEFISTPSKSPSLVEIPRVSPTSVPLPESQNTSPHLPFAPCRSTSPMTILSNSPGSNLQSFSPNLQSSSSSTCQISPSLQSPNLSSQLFSPQPQSASSASNHLLQRPVSSTHVAGISFLPSVSPPPPSTPPRSPPPPSLVSSSPSFTPSFVAPPPYHTVMSDDIDTSLVASTSGSPSGVDSIDRQPSISATHSPHYMKSRARARPPLPIGPRKPSGPVQPLGSFVPGIRDRNGSVSSVGSGYGSNYSWRTLTAAASTPPPKFQTPPPKWRGMMMEAAQWTLTQHELQTIVSRAIQQSAEASSIRLLKSETLDVDIPEEVHRLEMQRTDVKSRYKTLVRKRWQLMGTLAGHLSGPDLSDPVPAARTVEELSEVSLTLDQLTDELHNIVEQLGQLKSLRDVHSASALAMALRKVNTTFLKQVAESQKLREQIEAMEAERDEAWKQAELAAQDFDDLTDQVQENRGGQGEGMSASQPLNRRSARVSAVRKSSIRQSKAGLRSVRSRRSSVSSSGTRTSLITSMSAASDDIPPVPPLPLHGPLGIVTSMSGWNSLAAPVTPNTTFSAARALAQAQRELYEMLGLTLQETPSETSSPRPRSVSGLFGSRRMSLNPRPMSDIIVARPHTRQNRAIHSVFYDDIRLSITPCINPYLPSP
ncbi:hypothetical protein K503DRAFT_866950 [Rhizopogon vinicolor AM-OR11-026]|uniref:Uncharacterized protein n=1 Tax=Rhizopogon vinicolor AM-OR11-026 TaxID=1314800 RepID=A0A1B7MXM0_9AGAM|nr:hypothetical protein K503DRAFT_866950 [Rhizopogon vinicolor AM-OR11-026]